MQQPCISAVKTPHLHCAASLSRLAEIASKYMVPGRLYNRWVHHDLPSLPHHKRCRLMCKPHTTVPAQARRTRKSTALGLLAGPSGSCSASHREA